MVAPVSGKASGVVPVAPVVFVGGAVIVGGVATVGVVDDVADVEGEPNAVVVFVLTGPATLGEHAVAMANTDTQITQTPRLPDPVRMMDFRRTRAFWSGASSSAVDEIVCGAHRWYTGRRGGPADSRGWKVNATCRDDRTQHFSWSGCSPSGLSAARGSDWPYVRRPLGTP